jgi:hypothetical protein
MNLFHAPWLRQLPDRGGHFSAPDPRRRSAWRRARLASPGGADAGCAAITGDAREAGRQRQDSPPPAPVARRTGPSGRDQPVRAAGRR